MTFRSIGSVVDNALGNFEASLAKKQYAVWDMSFRQLFTAYVEQLKCAQEECAAKGATSGGGNGGGSCSAGPPVADVLRRLKRSVDDIVMKRLLLTAHNLQSPPPLTAPAPSPQTAGEYESPKGGDALPPLPLYLTLPLTAKLALLQDIVNPATRRDIVLGPDVFLRANVVAPFDLAVRKASTIKHSMGSLYHELSTINHLRFVLPFTTIHEAKRIAVSSVATSDALDVAAAQSTLRGLVRYFGNLQAARRALPEESPESSKYWHCIPPISLVTFSQESDILVSLIAQRKKAESVGGAVPPLSSLLDSPGQRLVQVSKYLLYRSALMEQKIAARRALDGSDDSDAAGLVIPVLLATRSPAIGRLAVAAGIQTENLNQFACVQTTTLLSEQQRLRCDDAKGVGTIGTSCSQISSLLHRRQSNMMSRT